LHMLNRQGVAEVVSEQGSATASQTSSARLPRSMLLLMPSYDDMLGYVPPPRKFSSRIESPELETRRPLLRRHQIILTSSPHTPPMTRWRWCGCLGGHSSPASFECIPSPKMRDGVSTWFMHGPSFTKVPSGLTSLHHSRNKSRVKQVERKGATSNPIFMLKRCNKWWFGYALRSAPGKEAVTPQLLQPCLVVHSAKIRRNKNFF
jgi:hypothetical protein